MKRKKHFYSKILEFLLLIASISITAVPVLFCTGMLSNTFKKDLPEHPWRMMSITILATAAILGFFSLVLRVTEIFTGFCSRIVKAGLILGIGAYLFFMVLVIPDSRPNKKLLLVYAIPLVTMFFSLRNIDLQRKSMVDKTHQ
jgi:hypothetical protein